MAKRKNKPLFVYDVLTPREADALQQIHERNKRLFDLATRVLKLAHDVFPLGQRRLQQLHPNVERTLLALYTQAFRLFRSMLILCKSGLDSEALIQLRSLLETTAFLLYIAEEDHLERFKRYLHSWHISRYTGLKELIAAFPETKEEFAPTTVDWHKRKAEEAFRYFREKHGQDKSDKEIRQKYTLRADIAAQELPKLRKLWKVAYPTLSDVAHGQRVVEYIRPTSEKNVVQLRTNPTSHVIEPCLVNGMRLLFLAMDKMNERLKLGKDAALRNLDEQYNHLFTEEPE